MEYSRSQILAFLKFEKNKKLRYNYNVRVRNSHIFYGYIQGSGLTGKTAVFKTVWYGFESYDPCQYYIREEDTMVNLGKGKDGNRIYMSYDEIKDAAHNPSKYLKHLNNQQRARLRKQINRYKRKHEMM